MSDDIDIFEKPSTPRPTPPPYHVESRSCRHGWVGWDSENKPTWFTCDCEDPENPWPPRKPTDGPVDCDCYFCHDKDRQDRGREGCEYDNHHCDDCHSHQRCTTTPCLEEWSDDDS
jgi:hypothetical protein